MRRLGGWAFVLGEIQFLFRGFGGGHGSALGLQGLHIAVISGLVHFQQLVHAIAVQVVLVSGPGFISDVDLFRKGIAHGVPGDGNPGILFHGIEHFVVILADPKVFTTLAFVTLDATGNREFSFARKPGADTCLTAEELPYDLLDECSVFHFGTLSLTSEPARTATQKAVAYAREKGKLISFDPNLRKPLWPNDEAAKEQIEWGLHQSDIVKISDEEIEFLWGLSPEEGARKLLKECGVRLVYATLGPKGCHFANRNGCGEVSSPTGIHVVDTTGAGDIFGGSAMSRFLRLGKAPEELTVEEMRAVTRFACCAASLSTQTHGGINSVPEEQAVEAIL